MTPRLPIALALVCGLALAHPIAPASAALPAARAAEDSAKENEKKPALVDLNSASKAELMKLPAVGEVIASRIIAGRPWRSKYDLVVKKVVTRAQYDKFAKHVIARQKEGEDH